MSGSQQNSLIDSLENLTTSASMDPGYHHQSYEPILIDQLRYEKAGYGSNPAHPSIGTDQSAATAFLDEFKNKTSRFAEDFVTQFSPVEEEPGTGSNLPVKTGSGFSPEEFETGLRGDGIHDHGSNQYQKKHVYTTSSIHGQVINGDGGGSFHPPSGKIHSPTGTGRTASTIADFDPEEFTYTRTGPLLVGNPVILKPEPDSLSEIKHPYTDDFDWSVPKPNQPIGTTGITSEKASAPPLPSSNKPIQDFDPFFSDLPKKPQQPERRPVDQQPKTGTGSTKWATTGTTSSADNFFSLKRLNPKLLDLIYWRDWRKSALFFVPVFALLLCLALFSFISVFAYAGLVLIAASLSLRLYSVFLSYFGKRPGTAQAVGADVGIGDRDAASVGTKNPLEPYLKTSLQINEEEVHRQVDGALKQWNVSADKFRSLLLSENLLETAKLAVVLWILTYIGSCLSFTALIVIAFVALFTLPKFYEVYQEPIDRFYALAETKIQNVTALINQKVSQFSNKKKQHGE